MSEHVLWVLVEDGPVFEVCQQWCKEYMDVRRRAFDWAKSHGFESVFFGFNSQPIGVHTRDHLEGWTKPNSRGLSRPKQRTKVRAEMEAIKGVEFFSRRLEQHFGPIPQNLSFKANGWTSHGTVGGVFGPQCQSFNGIDGPFLIDIPDMRAAQESERKSHPDAVFDEDYSSWENPLPETRVILKEEWDLMEARHRLAMREAEA